MEKCRKCGIWHNSPKCICENPSVMSEEDDSFFSSPINVPFNDNSHLSSDNSGDMPDSGSNFDGGGSSNDF